MLEEFFGHQILGIPIHDLARFVIILLAGLLFQAFVGKLLSRLLFKLFKKYSIGVSGEDFERLLKRPLGVFILLLSLYIAFDQVESPSHWELVAKEEFGIKMIFERSYFILLLGSLTWILMRIVDFFTLMLAYRASLTDTKSDDQLVPFLRDALKVIIIIFSFFFIAGTVFKLNVASLVAGLGIGGLALALAAKESLENLLGSFTIFLDKPFTVGDMVQVGTVVGTVEVIGFRSTRIRTLDKTFVTIPNKKMIDTELDNLSLRTFRRGRFNIGITYNTSEKQIRAIVADIQNYIDEHPQTNQEGKVRFMEFGASSLDIMVQYFVNTMDWDVYIAVRENINFRIMEIVSKHGSSFAFPTHSVYLEKTN